MIKRFFGRSDDALEDYQRAGGELGVFTLALVGVEDPYDPDPLWDRRYGGGARIVDKVSDDDEFRLQAALDGCRNSIFSRDAAGRFRERNPVFTDVVMWIPAAAWKAEAMRGGHRIEALTRNLEVLHGSKFKGSLPGDRGPIYTVMPDDALAGDEIVFQFGFGVFVPRPDDVRQATISMRRADREDPEEPPDWSFWHEGAQIKRPVGVYRGQKSLLIAPGADGPVRAPVWFTHGEGHILINLNAADSERIYADDDFIQVIKTKLPKDRGDFFEWFLEDRHRTTSAKPKATDLIVVRLTPILGVETKSETDTGEIELRKESGRTSRTEGKTAKRPKAAEKEKEKAREPISRGRRGFGIERLLAGLSRGLGAEDSTPLSSRYALRLAGIALLRVDGKHRLGGLREWVIWFDDAGNPVTYEMAETTDIERCLALSANARDGKLHYRLVGEGAFSPVVEIPCVLPTANRQFLRLAESPVPDRYHGLLFLPEEIGYPLSPKPLVIGRSNLDPKAAQPDLPLELLTHPDSLRWTAEGGYAGAKLNAINLSRRHVSMQLSGDKLELKMAEGGAPVYVLDEDANLVQTLEPKSKHGLELSPGQMIVLGSYLLRFHEERTRTMKSSEHSVLRRRQTA